MTVSGNLGVKPGGRGEEIDIESTWPGGLGTEMCEMGSLGAVAVADVKVQKS